MASFAAGSTVRSPALNDNRSGLSELDFLALAAASVTACGRLRSTGLAPGDAVVTAAFEGATGLPAVTGRRGEIDWAGRTRGDARAAGDGSMTGTCGNAFGSKDSAFCGATVARAARIASNSTGGSSKTVNSRLRTPLISCSRITKPTANSFTGWRDLITRKFLSPWRSKLISAVSMNGVLALAGRGPSAKLDPAALIAASVAATGILIHSGLPMGERTSGTPRRGEATGSGSVVCASGADKTADSAQAKATRRTPPFG